MICFDTSYVVRLYLEDPGWQEVRELAATDHIACCLLGYAEAVAAFHRKLRERVIDRAGLRALLDQFEGECDAGAFQWLPCPRLWLRDCGGPMRVFRSQMHLRAGDAIHLACAAENGFREIYSNDQHLPVAARHFSLRGVNVIGRS